MTFLDRAEELVNNLHAVNSMWDIEGVSTKIAENSITEFQNECWSELLAVVAAAQEVIDNKQKNLLGAHGDLEFALSVLDNKVKGPGLITHIAVKE